MKTCESIKKSLMAYLDGELEQRRAQEVEGHLQKCPLCQSELGELRRMDILLQSLLVPPRPEVYWPHALQDLRAKIQRLPRPARFPLLEGFRGLVESPVQVLVPVTFFLAALVNTVTILELEEEAFAFFSSYILPIVLL